MIMQRTRNLFFFMVLAVFFMAGFANAEPPVIQTQYGPNGQIEVDLIRCKVTGNVLTMIFKFRGLDRKEIYKGITAHQVYYIANEKKYHVLRDDDRHWLCAPEVTGYTSDISVSDKKTQLAWYKFPAPPKDVTKIQINLDDFTPFDEVEIQR